MSSPTLPITAPRAKQTRHAVGARGRRRYRRVPVRAGGERRLLAVDASRGGPPPEVLHQIAAAGRIEEQLRESGQQLRFLSATPDEHVVSSSHDPGATS